MFKNKKLLGLLLLYLEILFFAPINLNAQNDKTIVKINVCGSGKTEDEAKQIALLSAIEQVYLVYVSPNTEILSTQAIAHEITSLSLGIINSYEVLNKSQLPNGNWGCTYKVFVMLSKLTSFLESKGIIIEKKTGFLTDKIKQQVIYEQGEIKAIAELVGLLHEPMQISFDYNISSYDPKSLDEESKNWAIPIAVTVTANNNMDICANYCLKTLAALSLPLEEIIDNEYGSKERFDIIISYNDEIKYFYFRKKTSIDILNTLKSNWEFYIRSFKVNSGIDETIGNSEGRADYNVYGNSSNNDTKTIYFLKSGYTAVNFMWEDIRTLKQIEQITGYTIKPIGIVSQFKHGGFVVYEDNGHGLVVDIIDLGDKNWDDAKQICDELVINGYKDWYLPTKIELNSIYTKLQTKVIGGFANDWYWSSSNEGDVDA